MSPEGIIKNKSLLKLTNFTPLFLILLIISSIIWLSTKSASNFRTDLKQSILKELISINPPAPGKKVDVMYLLGGNQTSIEFKSKTASEFFHKGICKKIWVMSLPGITKYSQALGRNWTENEYSIMKLKEFGIPEENIEFIKVNEGFFGTYSEARDISSLIQEKQHKSILLITQPYHTHRVKISFNEFLADKNASLFVQDSNEPMLLRHLIVEYIKLKIYQYFLI
ncbi:MAG: YdcF family protein [Desulfobacteraceae bacterium]|nr:YdcF family protein [Desulfobacteraceae bacterium]MBC2754803.1 YdcF family protein [Desulfobacteraceae bacterium]